nr:E3 ubiquitin-protein ligase ZNRF2-like [Pongo abelii]
MYWGSDLPPSSNGGANGTAGGGGGVRATAGRFPAQVPSGHQPSASGGASTKALVAPCSRSRGGAVGSVASGPAQRSPPSASRTATAAHRAYRTGCTAALRKVAGIQAGGREPLQAMPGDQHLTSSPLAAHVWRC